MQCANLPSTTRYLPFVNSRWKAFYTYCVSPFVFVSKDVMNNLHHTVFSLIKVPCISFQMKTESNIIEDTIEEKKKRLEELRRMREQRTV